jgi:hypothetical protein
MSRRFRFLASLTPLLFAAPAHAAEPRANVNAAYAASSTDDFGRE